MTRFRRVEQQLFIRVCPLIISEGCPQSKLSEYVHYVYRRVVHKVNYRSMSLMYIGGLSTKKNKYLCFENSFSYMENACVRESMRT